MIAMVLPGTDLPSGGESAATLEKWVSLPEPRHGALVARMCDARRMGAHLPSCRFRLACSGASRRGAAGQQQPVRAQRRDEWWLNQTGNHRQVQHRQCRRGEQAAPKTRSQRVEGKVAVPMRPGRNLGACRSGRDLQPARCLRADGGPTSRVRSLHSPQPVRGGRMEVQEVVG